MPTLSKAERLYRQRTVSALFARGRRVRISSGAYMLKVYALLCDGKELDESASCVKAMFSAPKSSFKHAVDRNRMKRLLRESFRAKKADWTGLTELWAGAAGAASGAGAASPILLVAFIFTKIGKPAEDFVLKQADMQVYLDKAYDKLYRVWSDEKRGVAKAGRTAGHQAPTDQETTGQVPSRHTWDNHTLGNQTKSSHGENE